MLIGRRVQYFRKLNRNYTKNEGNYTMTELFPSPKTGKNGENTGNIFEKKRGFRECYQEGAWNLTQGYPGQQNPVQSSKRISLDIMLIWFETCSIFIKFIFDLRGFYIAFFLMESENLIKKTPGLREQSKRLGSKSHVGSEGAKAPR